jgi:hypothetical protein
MTKNMGAADRVLRILLAIVAGILYFTDRISGTSAIILSDPQGIRWNLDPGVLEAELSLLDGYDARLVCSGIPGRGGERDALVVSYVLVPPDGMISVLGSIAVAAESIFLNVDGDRYRLPGPLTDALGVFGDYRAWVWGTEGDGGTLEISGYEVLGP